MANTAPTVKVTRAPHTGITVPSLARSLALFHDTLGLPLVRTAELTPPLSGVTGHANATIHIAILALPGGHQIELLEYVEPADRRVYKPRSADIGSWHLCLSVNGIDAAVAVVAAHGYAPVGETQTITAGPSSGTRVCYVRSVDDGITIEFFEETPSGPP